MKQINLLTFLFFLLSCTNRPSLSNADTLTDTTRDNGLFKEFLNKIPSHHLPVNFSCGIETGTRIESNSEFEKFSNFIPHDVDVIFGLIGKTEKFKLIIFGKTGDDIIPIIFSFDNNGNRIDSLDLSLVGCGGADEYVIPYDCAQIGKDLHIVLRDTIKYIHFPDNARDYILDSIETSVVNYTIDNNGKINKK